MRKKCLKYLLVGLMLLFALSSGAACKDDKKTKDSGYTTETIESVITLDQTELTLKVGDKRYIVPSFEAQDGVSLVYTAVDETVARISEFGEVTALKEGSTNIVVRYGELSATCKVTVTLGGELPQIVVKGVEEGSLQRVSVGGAFSVAPYVWFNGGKYEDATFEYVIEDGTVVEEADGRLQAKACGETAVKIVAVWRGVKNATLERTFTLRVIADVELSVNGGLNSVVELYSVSELGGRSYTTELPFKVTASEKTENGVIALTATVSVASGKELITIENDVVSSNGIAGTASVKITCTASTGDEFEQTITVNVLRSVGVYDTRLEFSAADGELPLTDIFGGDEELTSAECEGEKLTISADKKCVLGLSTLTTGVTQRTITVYGQNVGYEIVVDAYTKIVNEASDLDYFLLDNENEKNVTAVFDGYYVLGGNIDASGYVRGTSGFVSTDTVSAYANVGLTGTFDGRGYAISNLTFGETAADFGKFDAETRKNYTYSLFGIIGGGTVKDLALANVSLTAPEAVTKGATSALATWVMGGTIENVYVHVNGLNYAASRWRTTAGLAINLDKNTVLKNVVVEVDDDGSVQRVSDKNGGALFASYGSFVSSRLPDEATMKNNFSNVYMISSQALKTTYPQETDGTRVKTVYDAENAKANADETTAVVKRYKNVDALMADESNVYETFDTSVWTVGTIPAWKSLPLVKYARVTVDGKKTDRFTVLLKEANVSYSVGIDLLGNTIDGVTLSMSGAGIALNGNGFSVLHAGTAEITVTYMQGGKKYSLTMTVSVTAETKTYAKTVAFSAMHGELPLTEIFGENVELVAAYQGDTLLQISSDKKRVLGVQTLSKNGDVERNAAVQTQIVVYSASKGYIVNLNAYAGILTTAEDLAVFNLDNTDYAGLANITDRADRAPTKAVDGYYILANDIDASGWVMPTQGYIDDNYQSTTMPKVGFQGTLDGCGHTISRLTFGTNQSEDIDDTIRGGTYWKNNHYSLFGIIGKNATVKNLAIDSVRFDLYNGTTSPSMASCATLAMWISAGATVENVYVNVEGVTRGGNATYSNLSAVAYGVFSGARLNNIVVDYTYDDEEMATFNQTSAFVQRKCASDSSVTEITAWTNVYVISAKGIVTQTGNNLLWAANDTEYDAEASTGAKVAGLYRYESAEEWKKATGDYTSFESVACWDMTTGVPVWKKQA